ncbi:MAG TPA: galactokinase family protein [Rectinemataceae bacterium]|nr:galactokinase family protein [Rectinemataceae bacterium]
MAGKESLEKRIKKGAKFLTALYGPEGLEDARERYSALAAPLLDTDEASPLRFYSAPGRTEIAGNHTDHNRGRVICAALRLDVLACVRPRSDRVITLVSVGFDGEISVQLDQPEARTEERGTTAALLRGVAAVLGEGGILFPGFDMRIDSRVAVGSGLSSSAALEVLFATIMLDLAGSELRPIDIAKVARRAENEWFGKPCGLMDQAASASGGLVAIDFGDLDEPKLERIDFDPAASGYRLFAVAPGGDHSDLTPDYAAIPFEMKAVASYLGAEELRSIDAVRLEFRGPDIRAALGDRALLRALHFADENERVRRMVKALGAGKFRKFLDLVAKSGDSSWRLLQNVSTGREPTAQSLALAIVLSQRWLGKDGVARVHGGGFAGTMQAWVREKRASAYRRYMEGWFGEGSVVELEIRGPGACRVL